MVRVFSCISFVFDFGSLLTLNITRTLIGINGIEFGDSRELYIQLGGNTNGGVPGRISGSFIQKDNYYSSATLVANIHKSGFNGTLTYDADNDGNPNGVSGIEFFCVGNRNPFGMTLHSNGYLYGTDNGPNTGYGEFNYLQFNTRLPFYVACFEFH
jgi:glucose/arabinose dehydrogenase